MTGTIPFPFLVGWFAAGIAVGAVVPGVGAVGVAVALGSVVCSGRIGLALVVGALGAGATAGGVVARAEARGCAEQWAHGARVAAYVELGDAPGRRRATTARIVHSPLGCDGTVRLRGVQDLGPGASAIVVGRHHARGVVRVHHTRALPDPPSWRARVRHLIAQRVRTLYGARAPFVEAIVLGRRDDLPPETRDAFVSAGLAHLLAISGLHVGLFAMWVRLAGRAVGLGRRADAVGAMAVWAYVAVLGFPAPATRAAAFISAVLLARRWQRHPSRAAILAVGAVAVLSVDPAAVGAVGAWLSFTAVWAVGRALHRVRGYWGRVRPLVQLGAASVGATIATAPITAFVFGQVAPVGVLSNLVGIPLAGLAVPGILTSLALGPTMAGGAGVVLAVLERWVEFMGRVPGGAVVGEPGLGFALPWLGVAGAVAWTVRARSRWMVVRLTALGAALVWGSVVVAVVRRGTAEGVLALHVLDVGQGDAIALETPRGQWVLIDAGPRSARYDAGRAVVVPFLRRHGVRRLAGVLVTHGDADHVGGAPSVLGHVPADVVVDPGLPLPSSAYLEYLAGVDADALPWRAGRAGDSLVIDGVEIAVMHPSEAWMRHAVHPNEASLVLHVRYGCFDALLMGDAGLPVEEALAARWPRADVLKVGHHGSRSASDTAFLARTRPVVAVISVGTNRYGHPTGTVLERLRAVDAAVYRTDRDGTVTIRSDGDYLQVDTDQRLSLKDRVACLRNSSPSNASFSSRSVCTRTQRVSLPTCSTTSRSPPR